jgi:hypothetical protein
MLDLFTIVLSILVACCFWLGLIYVTRVYATVLLMSTCSSHLKCVLLNRTISI